MAGEDRIIRTQTIDGLVTPAFINNGSHYFFIKLPVYADGLVNCWEMVDLALFKRKLEVGWVTTAVPDGQDLSVHELGSWTIADGRWALDAGGLFERVTGLVRELNPRMENLHDCHGRTVEKIGNVNVSILGSPREQPVRITDPGAFAKRIRGDHMSVFVRLDDRLFLADLRAYADGVIELARLPTPETIDLARLKEYVERGRVLSSPAANSRVEVDHLGSFTIAEESWSADIHELLRSVPDLIDSANGRPDSVQRCRAAYQAYLAEPTETRRDALRVAYEAVPEDKRRYVGDMDTKDVAVRMILYGDQEIEHWSHRAVARTRGEQLPTITVPKPTKD